MRNCSQVETRDKRFVELREKLMDRGYRRVGIDSAIEKVKQLERSDILERVVRENNCMSRVKAVFKFDMRLPNLSAIFRKNWQVMVEDDKRLAPVFPNPPMISFCRTQNQREELCRAKLPPGRLGLPTRGRVVEGFKRCGRAGCRLCH